METVYSIRGWDEHFEVSQSRKIRGALSWVGVPCKHDGKSFRRLMLMPDGLQIYGAWILIVQVAAKCPQRGVLADADGPLDTTDLAIKTGAPQELFAKALAALSDKKIGWIQVANWEDATSTLPIPTNQPDQPDPTNQPTRPAAASGSNGTAGRPAGVEVSLGWEAVADELGKLGVARWRDAIKGAQTAGCTAGQARRIIDYGTSHGFGPGAIVTRLKDANPSLPVDRGWPGKSKTQRSAEATAAAKQAEAKARAEAALSAHRAAEADAIIKAGRRAGKPEDQIRADLAAQNLEWPT